MTKQLLIACAGAGKTTKIVNESIQLTNNGKKILIITYTHSNQKELIQKFIELKGTRRDLFIVKGWYSFLLEDIIRPYQQCIIPKRIKGIYLNSQNPHKRNGYTISGRAERIGNKYNPNHFLTTKHHAHTEFISKLACRVISESKVNISERLQSIYDRIYLDETQDFAGWDFDLFKHLVKSKKLEIHAVGDFRQTIYHTSSSPKNPFESSDKLIAYKKMGFKIQDLNECWRSIEPICEFADSIHLGQGYTPTISKIGNQNTPPHNSVVYISPDHIDNYVRQFDPLILRYSSGSGKILEKYQKLMTFGESKGLTADHVLVQPTQPILNFLKGEVNPFGDSSISQNKFYVAVTRARYSVAFIVSDPFFDSMLWKPIK
ncbi:AAA family ATPase [Acinetobacter johnsonii]|nr:AAA family ATPase [Acinetobacter johnsonii]